jgi:hypothetical protein
LVPKPSSSVQRHAIQSGHLVQNILFGIGPVDFVDPFPFKDAPTRRVAWRTSKFLREVAEVDVLVVGEMPWLALEVIEDRAEICNMVADSPDQAAR